MSEQPGLFADERLPGETQARLNAQAQEILDAFKAAPTGRMTNLELTRIAQRFGGRIHELRLHGYIIETEAIDKASGCTTYHYRGWKVPEVTPEQHARSQHHGGTRVELERLNRALKLAWARLEELHETPTLTRIKDIMNGRI